MRRVRCRNFVLAAAVAVAPAVVAAQEGATISGRVTSEANLPLASASVFLDGFNLGTLTRDDGTYSFTVPPARVTGQQATLTARLIGFRAQSVPITLAPGAVTRDFTLAANPLQLGEVVVTGAGTVTTAEKLGSVRNNVDSTLIERSNEPNVVQALAAKAPNVEVTQTSGEPGSSSFIRIRGQRTLSGPGQPLFVVDGVPIDNESISTTNFNPVDGLNSGEIEGTAQNNRAVDINPDDIESVEILKGAAAGAIYGSRAGQGVVLITTKRGRPGPTRYSLNSSISIDDINNTYPLQRRFGQGLSGLSPLPCEDIGKFECRTSWGPDLTGTGTPTYDHANEAYSNGTTFDNTLTVSGGNERTTFFLSGSYMHNNGVFKGPSDRFERATVRLNATHRFADAFTVGGNISYADSRGRYIERGNNTNGLQLGLLRSPPDWNNRPHLHPESGLHRAFRLQNPTPTQISDDRGWANPFWVLSENENTSNVGRVFGNVNAAYSPVSWLQLNYTLGGDYASDERLEGSDISGTGPQAGGRITEGKVVTYQIDHNLTATANFEINQNLAGSITLGQNLNARNQRQLSVVGRALLTPRPFNLANTVNRDPPIDDEEVIRTESYFGQATFDLWQQLYLTLAGRYDGSSTFDEDNRRSFFPKASASWNVLREDDERNVLSFGKLRVAYGEAGQEPDPYLTSQTYISDAFTTISQGVGLTPTQSGFGGLAVNFQKATPVLKPERTKEFEAGFDVGLFRNRADLSFTWYNAKTEDVILIQALSPSSGFLQQAQQGAEFRNRGVELAVNVRPITTANFGWDIGVQWARNRSKVLELLGAEFVNLDPQWVSPLAVAMEGEAIGVWRDFGFARCGVSPGGLGAVLPDVALDDVCAGAPRGALYIGEDGFPVGDPNPRVVGDPNPDWTGSLRSTVRVNKLQFSGLLDIRQGGENYNGTRGSLLAYGTHKETEQRATCDLDGNCVGNERVFGQDGWFEGPTVGPGAGTPVPIGENWYLNGLGSNFGFVSEHFIEDGSYVKLREISVAYTLDQDWVRNRLGLSSIDLRVAGRNLKTWTDYSGYDPETNLGGAVGRTRGMDYFNMPQTRSFVFTVGLNR